MRYRCGHCGFVGYCYGTPTDKGVSAPWCSKCERNDKLTPVEEGAPILPDGTDKLCQALYGRAPEPQDYLGGGEAKMLHDAANEIEQLRKWIGDLQDGSYINCVYCGHQYPPGTPESRDKHLYEHIKVCPKHPLSKALAEMENLKKQLEDGNA